MKIIFVTAALAGGAVGVACGDDEGGSPQNPVVDSGASDSGGGEDTGILPIGDAGPDAPAIPPLYYFATAQDTAEGAFTYLNVVDTFDGPTLSSFDARAAGIELPRFPTFADHGGALFAAVSPPALIRFDVGTDRKLVQGKTVTFPGAATLSVGITNALFVNDEKAYYFDVPNVRIFVFNPTTMEIVGEPLSAAGLVTGDLKAVWPNGKVLGVRKVGNEWSLPGNVYDATNFDYLYGESGVVTINVETNAITSVSVDARCGDGSTAVGLANGDFYYFSSNGTVNQWYLTATPPKPTMCAPRLAAGQNTFDPGTPVNLSTLAGGTAAGGGGAQGAVADGANGFYFAVADEAQRIIDPSFFYKVWHYNALTGQAAAVAGAPFWGNTHMDRRAVIGGVSYAAGSGYDDDNPLGVRTIVFRFTPDAVTTFNVDGWVDSFGQLR